MQKQKDALTQLDELLLKGEQVKESYASAKEKAEQEVVKLKQEIADSEENLKEIYKSYVLADVTLDTWQAEKEQMEKKKSVLSIAETKVKDIDGLLKEELAGIYAEYQIIQQDVYKASSEANALLTTKLDEAKNQYLQLVREASHEYGQVFNKQYRMNGIKVDAGLLSYNNMDYRMTMHHHFPARYFHALPYDESTALPSTREVEQAFLGS